jgi:hypothetical protein
VPLGWLPALQRDPKGPCSKDGRADASLEGTGLIPPQGGRPRSPRSPQPGSVSSRSRTPAGVAARRTSASAAAFRPGAIVPEVRAGVGRSAGASRRGSVTGCVVQVMHDFMVQVCIVSVQRLCAIDNVYAVHENACHRGSDRGREVTHCRGPTAL